MPCFRPLLPALLAVFAIAPALAEPVFSDGFEPGAPVDPDSDAVRLLQQASFGPTLAQIARVRTLGAAGWIGEQMQMPASLQMPYMTWFQMQGADISTLRVEIWFHHALGGPSLIQPGTLHQDQLRQRVAFALSQLFVVSDRLAAIGSYPMTTTSYYDVLIANAFGNYRDLLEQVTLHPAMGVYLSMHRNRKADAALNIRPDENYAREVMQLFSIGLHQLHPDGTRVLADDEPVPTYTQETVRGFARAFTGWNWAGCTNWDWCPARWTEPMAPMAAFHDSANEKQLLVYPGVSLAGGVLPPGGTAREDLAAALDNIFHHPNVGPFVARHLIQQLVTSNPTPAYVACVAAVFDDDGHAVRGNLGTVVRAVLLDAEAREGHLTMPQTFGKTREPLLKLTHLWRAMDARSQSGRLKEWNPEIGLLQAPLRAPSVFNFFSPGYSPPGELTTLGLVAPEFQLLTDSGFTSQSNDYGKRIYYAGDGGSGPDTIVLDFARDLTLAADVDALLDLYDRLFLAGRMSPYLRTRLSAHLAQIPLAGNGARTRIRDALYLILTSPEYAVQQ